MLDGGLLGGAVSWMLIEFVAGIFTEIISDIHILLRIFLYSLISCSWEKSYIFTNKTDVDDVIKKKLTIYVGNTYLDTGIG